MTATFDHRATGTAAGAWTDVLAALPPLDPPAAPDRLLVLAAHPDDETLGAGGLIASATAAGVPVAVVIATDGEASHPDSPTHPPAELAAVRRREAGTALAALGVADVSWLELPDGDLYRHVGELTAAVREHLDGCTHLLSPWRGDRHPDHAACAEAAAGAAAAAGAHGHAVAHWQYPIWAWHWADPAAPPPEWAGLARLTLSGAAHTAKSAAMRAYRSQYEALSPAAGDEAILTAQTLAHFERPAECFVVAPAAATSGYFDRLYATTDDPWGLHDRFYEQRKRDLLMAALPRERFRRAFEPGCASGLITERLAGRCAEVVGWDGSTAPLRLAADRLSGVPGVQLRHARIPAEWPAGEFDLIVLSEVGYYCTDLELLAGRVRDSLASTGVLVACHWRHPAVEHPHDAAAVHAAVGAGLPRLVRHAEADFLLDVWSRDPASVAQQTGIVD